MPELVALARDKPGEIDHGSSGNGAVLHLAGVLLADRTRIELLHVPCKGTGPLTNDLVAGHMPLGFISVTAALPQVQAGTLKRLAVASAERVPTLPDVPMLDEAEGEGHGLDSWIAMVGPPACRSPSWAACIRKPGRHWTSRKCSRNSPPRGLVIVGSDPAEGVHCG